MAKGLRSSNKKALRHARRDLVKATEHFKAAEEQRFAKIAEALAQADESRAQSAAERPADMVEEAATSGRAAADAPLPAASEKMEVERDVPATSRRRALATRKGKGFKVKKAVKSVLNEEFHKRRQKGTRRGAFKRLMLGVES